MHHEIKPPRSLKLKLIPYPMSKHVIATALFLTFGLLTFQAQNTCESESELLEDLNSITKCTVEKTEKTSSSGKRTKNLTVKVSSSTRYLKRRTSNKQVASLGDINSSGLSSTNANTDITKELELSNSSKNISKLKEKLSKEQLQSAFVFADVDVIPSFEACEDISKEKGLDCFNEQMMAHIQEHFQYPKTAVLNKIQGNVWVRFVIDEEGSVTNLKTLAPKNGASLKLEAERVVSKLPTFTPAKKNGKNVLVKYGFPINFSLED